MTKETLGLIPQTTIKELTETQGTFIFKPLAPGFGTTLASALRRTLFSATQGYAITHIKIHPLVPHEFGTIEGVKEDLQEIILNLKSIRFKKTSKQQEEKVLVSLKNTTLFKGSDISKAASSFQVVNSEDIICRMEKTANFQIELSIKQGSGYEAAEEHKSEEQIYGSFPIDAIYTPIKNVTFDIENMLVGKRTDYEKLIMVITTDGSISPQEALKNASHLLSSIFSATAEDGIQTNKIGNKGAKNAKEKKVDIEKLLKTPITKLKDELPLRVINSLSAHGIEYFKDIIGKKVSDLLLLPSFGKQCLKDLEKFLKEKNIAWDTDVTKYP